MENLAFEGENNNSQTKSPTRRIVSTFDRRSEKFQVYKNVLLISFSFLLLFTAFESMSKLQSSINSVKFFVNYRVTGALTEYLDFYLNQNSYLDLFQGCQPGYMG